jgi:hypothetical protein
MMRQHFLSAAQRDFLMAVKSRCSESTDVADHGADTRTFASVEDATEQSACSRADGCMFDALAALPSGFDSALPSGGAMVT